MRISTLLLTSLSLVFAASQTLAADPASTPTPTATHKPWYEKLSLRGYAQVRYNRLLETNPSLKCEQCDKSWGNLGSVFMRRARLIVSGNVHDRVYVYIQPDLAQDVNGTQHLLQIRDLYFDLALDSSKEFRLRFGQSKVPFGWENLQSSSNRLALDRSDAINSAAPNERDLGVFFYWAPSQIRDRFKQLVDTGLKGSGDYGVVGFGAYNGQSANRAEGNNNRHMVAHLTYPWQFGEQFVETGVHAYSGLFQIPSSQRTTGVTAQENYTDRRVAASLIVYPQPIGFQIEWNAGDGPQYVASTNSIETTPLNGGYVLANYQLQSLVGQSLIPFVRAHFYNGGKKHETDARSYRVSEYELGMEWQPVSAFELTAMYTISSRRFEDATLKDNLQEGNLLRLQAQFNY